MRRLPILLLVLGTGCEGQIGPASPDLRREGPALPGGRGPAPPTHRDSNADQAPEASPGPGNAPSFPRRLSADEYAATVTAALGVAGNEALLSPEIRVQGFTNDYGTLIPSQRVVEGQRDYGRDLVEDLLARGEIWLDHEPCSSGADRCVEDWIQSVARPLFRRPVSKEEAQDFRVLFDTLRVEGRTIEQAVASVLRALLLAPQTVYRLESPEGFQATPVELASRIAFLVTGAGPDAALLQAGLTGGLERPDQIEGHVQRLLRTEAAARYLDRLSYGWLHLHTLEGLTPTGDPAFDRELIEGALALVRAVWLEDHGQLRDVLDAPFVIPQSARAARRMGLESEQAGVRVSVAQEPLHGGLLTDPAVLSGTGLDSFPLIHRALFIYRDLLCEEVPEPPPGVTDAQPGDPTDSRRQQSQSRMTDANCGGCHGAFDQLAYAFEPFAFGGIHSATDEFGNLTRTDGSFRGPDGSQHPFEDPAEFAAQLADDPRINPCILERLIRAAWGRALTRDDAWDIQAIRTRFEALGSTYEAALVAIATDPSFAKKRP